MIDTVCFRIAGKRRENALPSRWLELPNGVPVRVLLANAPNRKHFVECSLPRLFHGCNGRLIRNQDELLQAVSLLSEVVGEYLEIPPPEEWGCARMDLVYNYRIQPRPIIYAYQATMYPGIQGLPNLYQGGEQGISWQSDNSRFKLTFYDKCKQMRVKGDCLRVEAALRRGAIPKVLAGGGWLDFSELWRQYRRILVRLPPIPEPKPGCAIDFIGRKGPEVSAEYMACMAAGKKGDRTMRSHKQKLAACALDEIGLKKFSFEDFLPLDGPPSPVEVVNRKARGRWQRLREKAAT